MISSNNILEKNNDTTQGIDTINKETESDEEFSSRAIKPNCEVCNKSEYKYKCPNCNLKSCSLHCCNIHKDEKKCNGKYHHEKFIPAKNMDEKFLVKDLNYLTEMLRETENTKKKLSALRNPEQLRFKLLKIYSKKLTNINLKIAPQVMSIHRENLSFYHTKSKKIFWSVAIEFYQAPTLEKENKTSQIRILLDPQDEGMTLFEILSSVKIDNAQALLYLKQKLNSTSLSDGIKDAKLSCYLKLEENPREKQFKRCDHLEELQKILTGTSLIEYPCIYIVSYDDLDMFLKQVNIVKNK